MPDACDFITDVQLKAADDFTSQRLAQSILATLNDDCTACGALIPAVRRAAAPAATRCVPCQARHERKGVLHGRA